MYINIYLYINITHLHSNCLSFKPYLVLFVLTLNARPELCNLYVSYAAFNPYYVQLS